MKRKTRRVRSLTYGRLARGLYEVATAFAATFRRKAGGPIFAKGAERILVATFARMWRHTACGNFQAPAGVATQNNTFQSPLDIRYDVAQRGSGKPDLAT